jgi:UDPglucose 6-dehydrogenase
MAEAKRVFALDLAPTPEANTRLHFVTGQYEATEGADALVILTEWKAFKSPDFGKLKKQLSAAIIFDGRNLYEPVAMAELGIRYEAIGRASVATGTADGA